MANIFDDVRFPTNIAMGATGGPGYSTDVVTLYNGYEQRNINWARSKMTFNVAHTIKTQADMNVLIAFFRARQGKARGFRFRDWSDFQTKSEYIATADGTKKTFNLIKSYTSGATTFQRKITRPVVASQVVAVPPKIYLNGILQIEGSYVTISYTTGTLTFAQPPTTGSIITADFEFDVPVRFDTDTLKFNTINYNEYAWNDIPIVEILE